MHISTRCVTEPPLGVQQRSSEVSTYTLICGPGPVGCCKALETQTQAFGLGEDPSHNPLILSPGFSGRQCKTPCFVPAIIIIYILLLLSPNLSSAGLLVVYGSFTFLFFYKIYNMCHCYLLLLLVVKTLFLSGYF